MFYLIPLITLCLSASSVTFGALVSLPGLPNPAGIPPECGPSCAGVVGPLLTCSTFACFCTDSNIADLASCLQCVVDVGGALPSSQNDLDQIEGTCLKRGFNVPAETLSSPSAFATNPTPSINSGDATSTQTVLATSTSVTPTPTPVIPPTTSSPSSVPVVTVIVQPSGANSTVGGVTSVPSLNSAASNHIWKEAGHWQYIPAVACSLLVLIASGATQLV